MKIKGQKIEGPNEALVVIPRAKGDLVFKMQAVLDMTEFDTLCPEPTPPTIVRVGESKGSPDLKDKKYLAEFKIYSARRFEFLILKSLQATTDLEWETIDMLDPQTWSNYQSELKASGFTDVEIGRLINGVLEANSLDDSKIEEARKRFLASQLGVEKLSSSQTDEQ